MQPYSEQQQQHQGVKSIQVNRARIKERIQEKHRQQRCQVRQERLSGLREADGIGTPHEQAHASWPGATTAGIPYNSAVPTTAATSASPSSSLLLNPDGSLMMPAVQDWSDIAHEFGVNIADGDVMECLLAIEEEIRQEQLFQFYDQTHGNEWEEYYNSLTS